MDTPTPEEIQLLRQFLQDNSSIATNLQRLNFNDTFTRTHLQWGKARPEHLMPLLKGLQRLLRCIPSTQDTTTTGEGKLEYAVALLTKGVHSAFQIASLPKPRFLEEHAEAFGKEQWLMELTHQRATAIKSQTLLHYLDLRQSQAPHVKNTLF